MLVAALWFPAAPRCVELGGERNGGERKGTSIKGANDGRSEETPSDAKEGVLPANQAASAAKNSLAAVPPGSAPHPAGAMRQRPVLFPAARQHRRKPGGRRVCRGDHCCWQEALSAWPWAGHWPVGADCMDTVSTDDAYVNGHVTFVAPRVLGQVSEVLVDDNYRVKKGEVLVELNPEPYQVEVAIKAAVEAAETDLAAAHAQVPGQVARGRANRYKLEHAVEEVDNQIAAICTAWQLSTAGRPPWNWPKRTSNGAKGCFRNGPSARKISMCSSNRSGSRKRTSSRRCSRSTRSASASACRPSPPWARNLAQVPPDLDQNFSAVRQALGELLQSAAAFGYYPASWTATPKEAIAAFYKQDPRGISIASMPASSHQTAIKQAEAKLLQRHRDLDLAELNLRYCTIVSEIDGVVTGRNVNPGDNVQVGQSLIRA